jgi:anti-anti-sigma factor
MAGLRVVDPLRRHTIGGVAVADTVGRIVTRMGEDRVIVRLLGDIDLSLRGELDLLAQQLTRSETPVLVDAADLRFADCTVVGFLAAIAARAPVTVRQPTRLVRELLHLSGLADRLDIRPSGGHYRKGNHV